MSACPYGRATGFSLKPSPRIREKQLMHRTRTSSPISTKISNCTGIVPFALVTVLAATAFPGQGNAATKSWNAVTGNSSDSGNWSGGLPTASDDVVVDNGGTVTAGNSTYNTGNAVTVGQSGTGILNLVGGASVAIQGGTGTLTLAQNSGAFGTGALIKTGAGRLTMEAANDYTGGTTVNSGELLFGNGVTTLGAQSLTYGRGHSHFLS